MTVKKNKNKVPAWNAHNQFLISKNSKGKSDLNCKYVVANYVQEIEVSVCYILLLS